MIIIAKQVERDVEDYRDLLDEFLDSCHETIEICGCTFYASDILKECDPTAYRCALNDYVSALDEEDPIFECPICGEIHNDKDDATYCCQEEEEEENN